MYMITASIRHMLRYVVARARHARYASHGADSNMQSSRCAVHCERYGSTGAMSLASSQRMVRRRTYAIRATTIWHDAATAKEDST